MSLTVKGAIELVRCGANFEAVKAQLPQAYWEEFTKEFWGVQKLEIRHEGKAIVLPGSPSEMGLPAAASFLMATHEAMNKEVLVLERFEDSYPFEALLAVHKALESIYGWTIPDGARGLFGRPESTSFYTVRIGPKPEDSVQVSSGIIKVPGFDGSIEVDFPGGRLYLKARCKMCDRHLVDKIVSTARSILKDQSIYKNKAILLETDSDGDIRGNYQPSFIDLDGVDPTQLIHNEQTRLALEMTVWSVIERAAQCREAGIALGRKAVLAGDYGTGKTVTMRVTARKCLDNGWTFILLQDPRALAEAVKFAERYQPAVVAVEDIDRVMGNRTNEANAILNEVDGLVGGREIMIIATTNNLGGVHKAMLRPGRMDSIIKVLPPDASATEKLIRLYSGPVLPAQTDIREIVKASTGMHPAFIAEFSKRAVMWAVLRGENTVTEDVLLSAYRGIVPHYQMVYGGERKPETQEELLAKTIAGLIRMSGTFPDVEKTINGIDKKADSIPDRL